LLLGTARQFDFGSKFSLLAEANVDVTFDGQRNVLLGSNAASFDPHLGLEASYQKIVYVRAGVGNIQRVQSVDQKDEITFQPNIGLGLRIKQLYIDYALTDIGDQSAALFSNVFSLKFNIFKKS